MNLKIDTDTVTDAGGSLTTAGWSLSTHTDLAMGGCGSPRVAAVADDWSMWAKTTMLMLQSTTVNHGENAAAAAETFAAQDSALADSTP